jgi:hypothetical protein
MSLRNVFGIHTDVRGLNSVGSLLQRCALVKVVFSQTEAGAVLAWKTKAHPNAYWVGRTSIDQDATNPLGELQQSYKAAHTEAQARAVARWYAEWIASWAIPSGLSSYMFFEAGPNEEDPSTDEELDRAVWYSEEFVRRCAELGLLSAVGMYSYGKPLTLPVDGVDGWARWPPVFRMMDLANAGHNTPRSALQIHGYGMNADIISSAPYAIMRYLGADYSGPIYLGEYGWAQDGDNCNPASTEEKIRQLMVGNMMFGADDRFMGTALYDCRYIAKDPFKFDFMYKDLARALDVQPLPIAPVTVRTGGSIIEVPPQPEPEPAHEPQVRVFNCGSLNVRTGPGTSYPKAPLAAGTEVKVLGHTGDWVQIETFVHEKYLEEK